MVNVRKSPAEKRDRELGVGGIPYPPQVPLQSQTERVQNRPKAAGRRAGNSASITTTASETEFEV